MHIHLKSEWKLQSNYTDPFHRLLFEKRLDKCKQVTENGRLINQVQSFEANRKCVLKTHNVNLPENPHTQKQLTVIAVQVNIKNASQTYALQVWNDFIKKPSFTLT